MKNIIKNNVKSFNFVGTNFCAVEMSDMFMKIINCGRSKHTNIKIKLKQIVEPKMCRFSYSRNIQKSMSTEYNDFTFYLI